VLGLAALAAPSGVPVSPAAMRFDVPVMIAAEVACLPIFFTNHRIDRWEGFVLLGYFVAYVAFLVLDAAGHDQLPVFSAVMLAFVIPLTVLTFGVATVREVGRRTRSGPRSGESGFE
jgi:cation:H+ antiporter